MPKPLDIYWTAGVNFTMEWYEYKIPIEKWDTVNILLERLKYVDEVCLDHQCWVKIDPDTYNPVVAVRRCKIVADKIQRILERYRTT